MILLMGLPGSGKGTQGKMMADQHGMHLVSMGELVRIYVTGHRRMRMMEGELLDDEEVIAILERVLDTIPDMERCVLDGFPRTIPQAEWLLVHSQKLHFSISMVVNLEVDEETVRRRLQARGRKDDRQNVIDERLKEYEDQTKPLLKWYREHNIPLLNVDAARSVDAVNDDVIEALNLPL